MEALRAEIELKRLIQAPPPLPISGEGAWDLEEESNIALSMWASNCLFQDWECVFSPRSDPFPEVSCQAPKPAGVEAKDGSEASLRSSVSTELA